MEIISELEQFLNRAESVKGNDVGLVDILTELEVKYNIPTLVDNLEEWEENNPDADRIRKAYMLILSFRSAKANELDAVLRPI
ncbi:hypothetical protein [Pelosinus sp. sgz500959]|uniref:hypothetical protein n=1 Tax=Pelosinus sp. sgz500959 TaxID=3242472 RepID=UPI00367347E6